MVEIERKFILPQDIMASMPNIERSSKKYLEQGYMFQSQNAVMRVRMTHKESMGAPMILGTTGGITIKYNGNGGNLARPEFEYDIPVFDALFMMKRCPNRISKTRYMFKQDGVLYEVDVFDGDHLGLIMAEVEFDSIEKANSFEMPAFAIAEVTDDHRYSNSNLSRMNREMIADLLKEMYATKQA